MTNDRAVEILNAIIFMLGRNYDTDEVEEAIHMAIEALEAQESCNDLAINLQPSKQDDLISRQAAIDTCMRKDVRTGYDGACLIAQLPPAQPEVTEEAVKEYCRKRCLCIVDSALLKKYESAQLEIISEWWEKQKDSAQGQCELIKMYPTGAWYCCNAQRRITDGCFNKQTVGNSQSV